MWQAPDDPRRAIVLLAGKLLGVVDSVSHGSNMGFVGENELRTFQENCRRHGTRVVSGREQSPVHTKIVLPETTKQQTNKAVPRGRFFALDMRIIYHKSKIISLIKEVNNMKNEILIYYLPDGAFCGAFVIQKG